MNTAKKYFQLGVTMLAISTAVFGALAWRERSIQSDNPVALTGAPYLPEAIEALAAPAESWNAPAPLSRGGDWVYELFTPPEIFYDARARRFAVKPPPSTEPETTETPFGVELVAVKRDLFRLQLIGHVGEQAGACGIFENRRSGEIFLASSGRKVPDLALSVQRFAVHREAVAIPDSMTVDQRVATAVVHDDETQQDITLTERERHPGGAAFAVVVAPGEETPKEVRAGDTFQIGGAVYRIETISFSSASIEVVKIAPSLNAPDRRTLTLRFAPSESTASTSP